MKQMDKTTVEHASACELASEVVRRFGSLRFRATGSSMLPAVRAGDVLTVGRREIAEVKVGDLVVFRGFGGIVAHRVVAHHGAFLITRGDSLPQPDPAVSASQLIGAVTEVTRRGRRVAGAARPGILARAAAALLRNSDLTLRLWLRLSLRLPQYSC